MPETPPNLLLQVKEFQWAIVVLILGAVALWRLGPAISAFISRADSIGAGPLKVSAVAQSKLQPVPDKRVVDALLGRVSAVVLRRESAIRKDLKDQNFEIISEETVNILIRQLAFAQLLTFAESVYNGIFGSQIILLKWLNQSADGITSAEMGEFIDTVRGKYVPLAEWTNETYLRFLIMNHLMRDEGGHFYITDEGNEFLIWLARSGKSEDKAL